MTKWRQIKRRVADNLKEMGDCENHDFIQYDQVRGEYKFFCKVTGFRCGKIRHDDDFLMTKRNGEMLLHFKAPIPPITIKSFRLDKRLIDQGDGIYRVLSAEEAAALEDKKSQIKCCANCKNYRLVKYVGYRCTKDEGLFKKIPSAQYSCTGFVNIKQL